MENGKSQRHPPVSHLALESSNSPLVLLGYQVRKIFRGSWLVFYPTKIRELGEGHKKQKAHIRFYLFPHFKIDFGQKPF